MQVSFELLYLTSWVGFVGVTREDERPTVGKDEELGS